MKFIKFTETRKGYTGTQIFAVAQLLRVYTEVRTVCGAYCPFIVFQIPGCEAIARRLKTPERPIMGIITEFLEGEATMLEITEYLATEED